MRRYRSRDQPEARKNDVGIWKCFDLNLSAIHKTGAPGAIPTRDLPLRRRTLYAAELREHNNRIEEFAPSMHS